MPFDSHKRRVQLLRGWPNAIGMADRKQPEWLTGNLQNHQTTMKISETPKFRTF